VDLSRLCKGFARAIGHYASVTDLLSGLLLAAWLVLEVALRKGDEARSWRGGDADRSSTRLVVVAYIVAFLGPFLLDTSGVGVTHTGSVLAWIGVSVGVAGLAIRVWSMRVLGRDYTRSLRTRESQSVIERGPYRLVRHPGYVGSILVWVGSRLAVNWLVAAATALALLLVYAYRISAEEQMLVGHFGDAYQSYRARTWRLVPFVW
jgi:protein-S-isoprenylcysteine O-methyltransferase